MWVHTAKHHGHYFHHVKVSLLSVSVSNNVLNIYKSLDETGVEIRVVFLMGMMYSTLYRFDPYKLFYFTPMF